MIKVNIIKYLKLMFVVKTSLIEYVRNILQGLINKLIKFRFKRVNNN